MQVLDPTRSYRLNPSEHPGLYLGIHNVNTTWDLTLVWGWNVTEIALNFTVTPSTVAANRQNICTPIEAETYCLDQWGNNASQAALQQAGNVFGQQWSFNEYVQGGQSYWNLFSDFAGISRPLSVIMGNASEPDQVVMSSQEGAETAWFFEEVGNITTSMTSPTSTGSATSGASTSSGSSSGSASVSSTPTAATSSDSSKGVTLYTGLSSGAIAGTVIGVVLAVILFGVGIGFVLRKRRRKRRSKPELDGVMVNESKKSVFSEKHIGGSSSIAAQHSPEPTFHELSADASTGGQRSELPTRTLIREV